MTLFYLILGLLGSSFIAFFGFYFKAISKSGILATIFIGTTIAVCGNFSTWPVIIFLFGSSFCISWVKKLLFHRAIQKEKELHQKNEARDALQIFSNTLPATLCLIAFYTTNNVAFLVGYLASLSGATADTWSSEIGILSTGKTWDILTFKKIDQGLSGGISWLGTISGCFGSLFSTACFFFFNLFTKIPLTYTHFLLIFGIGILASAIDSLLGSLFQAKYKTIHNQLTEKEENTQLVKGITWITNDVVNLSTNLISAFLAIFLAK
ncbi:DUF92 domain-containing protein [Vagococcus hydrophili]|uniref:DUF92 domain-containing protein n=1 Tax=Vagococcus hydrophili TaxID=2714947 RepID=A0A6G8ARK6_9ENTE|nr:DUF92 domain-containing protein [Vagococcus hydrophili]QIL47572.1 DUF92 domain-containing protein [Vagococcus hydrophili]